MNTDAVTLFINEIMDAIKKAPDKETKVALLQKHDCQALQQIMYANFAENIQFLLPKGPTPYKPSSMPLGMAETNLFREARKIYLFIENSSAKLTQIKRETLWTNLLELVNADEAIVMESMRRKSFEKDYALSRDVVESAYPKLLPAKAASAPVPAPSVKASTPSRASDIAIDAKAEARRLKRNEYARKYATRNRAAAKAAKAAVSQSGTLELSDVNKSEGE